jgi:DegV family protein with EDD domain
LSGTVRSAETARLDFPELDIRVIDTRLVASPLGVVVHRAGIWALQGLSADLICAEIFKLSQRSKVYFLVATLDYLAKGGRIGSASALIGNAFQIKPILTINDGKIEQFSKERTFSKSLNRLKKLILDQYPSKNDGHLTIMHADNSELANALAAEFEKTLLIPTHLVSDLPPAVIAHAGPGSIAVGFFESPEPGS